VEAAGQRAQYAMRVGVVARLAENLAAAFDYCVRAEHQRVAGAPRDRERLLFGHPEREFRGRLLRLARSSTPAFGELKVDPGCRKQCRRRGEVEARISLGAAIV